MQYIHLYIVIFIALISTAFVYFSNRKQEKTSDALTTIRLNRLLHYRDKSKLLDDFMQKRINPKKLADRYEKIEEEKKRYKLTLKK